MEQGEGGRMGGVEGWGIFFYNKFLLILYHKKMEQMFSIRRIIKYI